MTVRSLYVGYSGLTAMGHNIDVIGNNIANVNTVGFRAGRAAFDDIFSTTLFPGQGASGNRGGINPRQVGLGVQLGSVDTIFTQGSTQNTGRLLDLAINGEGFFVLRNGTGQEFLTRAGNYSIDNEGFLVDPGTGFRLIGRTADENGDIEDQIAPSELQVDFDRISLARQTENVRASGNFNNQIGEPTSNTETLNGQSTTNLLGMFDEGGNAFGLINGDVIQFETGYFGLGDPPDTVESPIDLTSIDAGRGAGVLLTVSSTTTVEDLRNAMDEFLTAVMGQVDQSAESGIGISFEESSGSFSFNNFGENNLQGVRVGLQPRGENSSPPADASRMIGTFLSNNEDPDFTRTLNVDADSEVLTNSIRRADVTTSIDVFDSQGGSHTVNVGLAKDTEPPSAIESTLVNELKDINGNSIIPGGVIPPPIEYSEPVINSANDTATFTARQISNMVVTQGVYTFNDANDNLIALRLSDGAISFNGNAFNEVIGADGAINAEISAAGLDVTGDSFLNLASNENAGGGLLGDDGFTENTTMESIRSSIENRINTSIRQVAANLDNIDAANTLAGGLSGTFASPADIPEISVELTEDGTLSFRSSNGSLGASASSDATINAALDTVVGGEDNYGLVVDLAAQTRTVRVSTIDTRGTADPADDFADREVDDSFADGGGVTGFLRDGDPFNADIAQAFAIGNTDFDTLDPTGDPTAAPPTGIDDSGVQLVALSSGRYDTTNDPLLAEGLQGFQAFSPETTAFRAIFNQRGYGIASNFDGSPGVDRTEGVPIGIVAENNSTRAFETNSLHRNGNQRNTVNFQVVTPSDFRTIPTQSTGTLIFDSNGRFQSYGGNENSPSITFDPDNGDPENNGVDPISFNLDLSGISYNSGTSTAQLVSQDGRPVGSLDNVSIATNGEIVGLFTNGDAQTLGQILLADVTNPGGLLQEGATLFTEGPNSGERFFLEPDVEGGAITSGTLELSNVDLAKEFTDLIVAQRAYQANTRVVTTADQVLTEVVNLKR